MFRKTSDKQYRFPSSTTSLRVSICLACTTHHLLFPRFEPRQTTPAVYSLQSLSSGSADSQATLLPPSPHNRSLTRTTPRTFDPQASVSSPPPRRPGLRGSSSGTHSGTGLVIFHCLELPLTSCAPSELRREPVVHFLFRKSLTFCPRTPSCDLERWTLLRATRFISAYSRVCL